MWYVFSFICWHEQTFRYSDRTVSEWFHLQSWKWQQTLLLLQSWMKFSFPTLTSPSRWLLFFLPQGVQEQNLHFHWFLVFRNILLFSSLIVALPARVFDSFMYYHLMFSKTFPLRELLSILLARVLDSIMYIPFMFIKTSLCSCLRVALSARVFNSFMYCPFVFIEMNFLVAP